MLQPSAREILAQTPLFYGVDAETLDSLADASRRRLFASGAYVVRQGEPGQSVFLLLAGRVSVERQHPGLPLPLVLAELGPGEIVGEMSLLNGVPRSASVVATARTEVLELDAAHLSQVLDTQPSAVAALLHVFTRRLRRADALAEQVLRRSNN